MVSWTYAFRKGLYIWLWTILWGIVGGVVAIAISGGSILVILTNPSAYTTPSTWMGAFAGIILGAIIGGLIASIGNYATIVKIVLESAEETKKT